MSLEGFRVPARTALLAASAYRVLWPSVHTRDPTVAIAAMPLANRTTAIGPPTANTSVANPTQMIAKIKRPRASSSPPSGQGVSGNAGTPLTSQKTTHSKRAVIGPTTNAKIRAALIGHQFNLNPNPRNGLKRTLAVGSLNSCLGPESCLASPCRPGSRG